MNIFQDSVDEKTIHLWFWGFSGIYEFTKFYIIPTILLIESKRSLPELWSDYNAKPLKFTIIQNIEERKEIGNSSKEARKANILQIQVC